jgi:ABC-2 type transport system permease protein
VSGETKESFVANDEIENPSNLRAGRFDLTFFVVFIAPLLLIAFSYDLLAQDREQQRLCMILSTSVPVGLVLAARASIRLLIVLSPIALATLIGALLGGDGLGLSMVGWLLVVALYLSFWSALACLVNLSRCAPATNAAVLGAVWLLMAVLLPAGLSSAINAATPAPTRAALVNQIRDIQTEVGNRYEAQRQAMPPNGVLNARDFDIAVKRLWVQEQAGRQIDALLRDVQSKADARQTLVEHWGGLSPVLLAHQALLAFSGSSPARYRDFSNQVDRFHREWRDYFAPKVVSNTPLQLLDIDQRPRFAFIDEPQRAVTEAASALVSLGLYFGGALLLMAWQLRRFRLVP